MSEVAAAIEVDETVAPIRVPSSRSFGLVFLLTAGVWTLALPWFSLAFVNHYRDYEVNFIQGLYERKHVAAERAAGVRGQSRLIIVGGSGALFGIDAELMERKLGIPTVNFATHAGLGIEYLLDRARRELRPGDRVLLCPEYQLLTPTEEGFDDFAWEYATSYDSRFLRGAGFAKSTNALYSIALTEYADSLRGWSAYRKGRQRIEHGPYNVATLSANGDVGVVTRRKPLPPALDNPLDGVRNVGNRPHVRDFAGWARANRVELFFAWPNHCRPGDQPRAAKRPDLHEELTSLGFTMLDEPGDAMFPREWYLDTVYHIDSCARRLRTEDLVRRLKPAQEVTGYYAIARGEHRVNTANAFADQPGVRVKYLAPTSLDHPDAITTDALVKLCESNLPVYTDDPEVLRHAAARGWSSVETGRTTERLGEWVSRYPDHVFLVAGGGGDAHEGMPADVRAALREHAVVAAAFGAGRFGSLRKIVVGDRQAVLHEWLAEITGAVGPDLRIRIVADKTLPKPFSIALNRVDLAGEGAGPHVVVVDPAAGIVVNFATFDDPGGGGAVTGRMFRLVKQNR